MPKKKRRSRPSPALDKVLKNHRDLLGVVPDRVVAERAGVSLGTVRTARRSLDITAAHLSGGKAKTPDAPSPAPKAAPTAVPSTGWVWRVTYGPDGEVQQGYVVAQTPVTAVKALQRVPSSEVLKLERMGPLV